MHVLGFTHRCVSISEYFFNHRVVSRCFFVWAQTVLVIVERCYNSSNSIIQVSIVRRSFYLVPPLMITLKLNNWII